MDELRLEVRVSMFVLDGGPNAALPEGSGGPILAGREAIFVAGRVELDAPTIFRVGAPGGDSGLILGFSGSILTPRRILRVVTVEQEVLGELSVPRATTFLNIYLSDLVEPDEVFVAVGARDVDQIS